MAMAQNDNMGREVATLGGGCFWCLEAVFADLKGVERVVSGYAGGTMPNPTYAQVSSGRTGHAEVVQITFDPEVLSYRELLDVYFSIHDPTTLNRQGAEVGTQYRSAIFYHGPEQKAVAEDLIKGLNASGEYRSPLVTQLLPAPTFYPAEEYHQRYFQKNTNQPYCQMVVAPKVSKAHKRFILNLKSR